MKSRVFLLLQSTPDAVRNYAYQLRSDIPLILDTRIPGWWDQIVPTSQGLEVYIESGTGSDAITAFLGEKLKGVDVDYFTFTVPPTSAVEVKKEMASRLQTSSPLTLAAELPYDLQGVVYSFFKPSSAELVGKWSGDMLPDYFREEAIGSMALYKDKLYTFNDNNNQLGVFDLKDSKLTRFPDLGRIDMFKLSIDQDQLYLPGTIEDEEEDEGELNDRIYTYTLDGKRIAKDDDKLIVGEMHRMVVQNHIVYTQDIYGKLSRYPIGNKEASRWPTYFESTIRCIDMDIDDEKVCMLSKDMFTKRLQSGRFLHKTVGGYKINIYDFKEESLSHFDLDLKNVEYIKIQIYQGEIFVAYQDRVKVYNMEGQFLYDFAIQAQPWDAQNTYLNFKIDKATGEAILGFYVKRQLQIQLYQIRR